MDNAKKEAAAGDANTYSGKENNDNPTNNIAQRSEEIKPVNPPMWKAAEVRHEQKRAAEKMPLLRYGLLKHCPARWTKHGDSIDYEQITALIYRTSPYADGYTVSVELLDKCGHSVTVAAAAAVEPLLGKGEDPSSFKWESGTIGERLKELKKAMRLAYTVKCHHVEMRRISAIIIRSPSPGRISLEVELVMPEGDGSVYIVPENRVILTDHLFNRAISGGPKFEEKKEQRNEQY